MSTTAATFRVPLFSGVADGACAVGLKLRQPLRSVGLSDLLQAGPTPHEDIRQGAVGIPLSLKLRLSDPHGLPRVGAVVCVWHFDPQGWTMDFMGDELESVARMRGMQFSDDAGAVGFRTVYPGRYSDGTVAICLQVFLCEGDAITACTEACLSLPAHVQGPLRSLPVALALPTHVQPPRWGRGRDRQMVRVPQVRFDVRGPGLVCQLALVLST